MAGSSSPIGPPEPSGRTWFHPSELPADPVHRSRGPSRTRRVAVPITAGLAGAVAALGLTALVGGIGGSGAVSDQTPAGAASGLAVRPTALAGPGLDDGFASVAGAMAPSVVSVTAWQGSQPRYGSAVVYRSDGVLVTSASVVEGATGIEVDTDGTSRSARLVGIDSHHDLAVLEVAADTMSPVRFDPAAAAQVGASCIILGAGDPIHDGPAMARGVIAGAGMVVPAAQGWMVDVIEVDAPAHPSSAGGALLDASGQLLGVVTGTERPGGGPLVVPSSTVRRSVDQVLTTGVAEHAWLGVAAADAGPGESGARVRSVAPGSPAARAGLDAGDLVVKLGERGVTGMASLMRAVHAHQPGDNVVVTVIRHREEIEFAITLTSRAEDESNSEAAHGSSSR